MTTTWQKYINSGKPLPATFPNLRKWFGEIANQGVLNACTAFATISTFEAIRQMEGYPVELFSQLAQWYKERVIDGQEFGNAGMDIDSNVGSTEEIALEILVGDGAIPMQDDPWNTQVMIGNWVKAYQTAPTTGDWVNAVKLDRAQVYHIDAPIVNSTLDGNVLLNDTLDALAQGLPVLLSIVIYQTFEQPDSYGDVAMPDPNSTILGYHQIVAIGADMAQAKVLILNSWGPTWGVQLDASLNGCGWLPFDYIRQNVTDAFVIKPEKRVPVVKPDIKPTPPKKITPKTVETYELTAKGFSSLETTQEAAKVLDKYKVSTSIIKTA